MTSMLNPLPRSSRTGASPPADGQAAAAEIAALAASRICHDLVNPLGAVGNGVELLALGARTAGPEVALLLESLAATQARLGLFRLAYGPAGSGSIARRHLVDLLGALTRGGRLSVAWLIEGEVPRPMAKLALLLVQCAEAALPAGGRIAVAADGERWRLEAKGPRLRIEPAHWAALARPEAAEGLGPAEVQFLLAGHELRRQGRRLESDLGAAIRLTF